jgi:hypothetical protein
MHGPAEALIQAMADPHQWLFSSIEGKSAHFVAPLATILDEFAS